MLWQLPAVKAKEVTCVSEFCSVNCLTLPFAMTDLPWDKEPPVPVKAGKDDTYYPMDSPEGNYALLFINENFDEELDIEKRKGANKDLERLINSLQKRNFARNNIKDYFDPTKEEILTAIEKVRDMEEFPYDCLFIAICTHGHSEDLLYSKDGYYYLKELWSQLVGVKHLAGKPKIFLIQACKGGKPGKGINVIKTDGNPSPGRKKVVYSIPEGADFYFMFSTSEGYLAVRIEEDGCPYIRIFCEELDKNEEHLKDLHTTVTNRMSLGESWLIQLDKEDWPVLTKLIPSERGSLTRKLKFK